MTQNKLSSTVSLRPMQRPPVKNRRGMTLVELLVVVSIVVLLASIAIPAIGPMLEGQVIPNAASDVKIYMNRARTRAIETRRPCGVLLERMTDIPGAENCAMVLRQVECPPPYGGMFAGSKLKVTGANTLAFDPVNPMEATAMKQLVQPGDSIQLNYQGKPIEIDSVGSGTITLVDPVSISTGTQVPFKIFRQPVPSSAAPMALPRGTLIDLEWSGIDKTGTDFDIGGTDPVVIMFSPSGVIDSVYYGGTPTKVNDLIYLNIGTWERSTYVGPEDGYYNYQAPENLWLTITPRTGLLTISDVALDPIGALPFATVPESRYDATNLDQSL